MSRRRRRKAGEHTFLSVRVDRFNARSGVDINLKLLSNDVRGGHQDELVHVANTWLEVRGTCTFPAKRVGELYEITLGRDCAGEPRPTFGDVQARDAEDLPIYRTRRGIAMAIYRCPSGLGVIHRNAVGDRTFFLPTEQWLVSDWLGLLARAEELFLSIHEFKFERKRWVRSISLQTTDPSLE